MTATNHALTGAIIGLTVQQPLLALPLALLSHFVLDVLPHYGSNLPQEVLLKTKGFRYYLYVELVLCMLLVAVLVAAQPAHWFLAAVCAFVAAAPDLLSINRYFKVRTGSSWKPGWYSRFASAIQWFERPIGAIVEVAWAAGAIAILAKLI